LTFALVSDIINAESYSLELTCFDMVLEAIKVNLYLPKQRAFGGKSKKEVVT